MIGTVVVLRWTYSPPDYFDKPIDLDRSDYTLKIADGKVEARLDPAVYEATPLMYEILHTQLNNRFQTVQLVRRRKYDLSRPNVSYVHPDGRIDMPTSAKITSKSVVYANVKTYKNGVLVSDSPRDSIENEEDLFDLIQKYRSKDKLLEALLQSYSTALNDPNNELWHLYEIRDALVTRFVNEYEMRIALNISHSELSWFRKLCNREPLRQGRHRGENYGKLRDATYNELSKARRIAVAMIEAYIQYLESQ